MATEENLKSLFATIGEFVCVFAQCETMLHCLLREITNLPDSSARIIFSGMGNTYLIKTLKDLIATSKAPDEVKTQLNEIFEQFNKITKMRNHIMHRWNDFSSENMVITTNKLTAKKRISEDIPYDHKTIKSAVTDLYMITASCELWVYDRAVHSIKIIKERIPKGILNNAIKPIFPSLLGSDYTWRYKPLSLKNTD